MVKDFILHMSSDELLTGAIWFLSMLAFVMLLIPFLIRPERFKTGGGQNLYYGDSFIISLSII